MHEGEVPLLQGGLGASRGSPGPRAHRARAVFGLVPDGTAAARVALELVNRGVRLIELHHGFDLEAAAAVIAAVGDRVPVGVASYGADAAASPGAAAARHSATIYADDHVDPAGDRVIHTHRDGTTTTIVGVPDHTTVDVATALVRNGVEDVVICGGSPLTTAARVAAAVPGATVGHVRFPFESIDSVAAYKAAYEAATGSRDRPRPPAKPATR